MNINAVVEVDALLKLVGAFRLDGTELTKLDMADMNPSDMEGYFLTTQQVLVWRSAYNTGVKAQLKELDELAQMEAIELPEAELLTPTVNIPIFGLGL